MRPMIADDSPSVRSLSGIRWLGLLQKTRGHHQRVYNLATAAISIEGSTLRHRKAESNFHTRCTRIPAATSRRRKPLVRDARNNALDLTNSAQTYQAGFLKPLTLVDKACAQCLRRSCGPRCHEAEGAALSVKERFHFFTLPDSVPTPSQQRAFE